MIITYDSDDISSWIHVIKFLKQFNEIRTLVCYLPPELHDRLKDQSLQGAIRYQDVYIRNLCIRGRFRPLDEDPHLLLL